MNRMPRVLAEELAALKSRPRDYILKRYTALFGEPPRFQALPVVRDLIACKLQGDYYGGLKKSQEDALIALLDEHSKMLHPRILPGTRLRRLWHDQCHEVIVRADGRYEYEGERFHSLTAIAERITGKHRSGKEFFGLI